jgi:hypothetical protein
MQVCNENDFEWYFDIFYGNCYRFNNIVGNNKTIKKLKKSGIINGLTLEIFLGLTKKSLSFYYSQGVRLFIDNNSFISSSILGFDVSPGFETSIDVSRVFSSKIPTPKYYCLQTNESYNSDLYKATVRENRIYRKRF